MAIPIPADRHFLSLSDLLSAGFSYYRINKLVSEGRLIKLNNKTYENTAYSGGTSDFEAVSAYAPKGIICMMTAAPNYGPSLHYIGLCCRDWLKTHESKYSPDIHPGCARLGNIPELYSPGAPGNTCLAALHSSEHGSVETPINNSKDCGGVMHVAPVGLYFNDRKKDIRDICRFGAETAALTHGHPHSWMTAAALAQIIHEGSQDNCMRRILSLLSALILALTLICTQGVAAASSTDVSSRMEKRQISLRGMDFHFWLYTPDNTPEDPALIIYLHGGTSKGDDLDLLVSHSGLPQYLLQGQLEPSAYIAMPQASEEIRSWDELGEEIIGLVETLTDQYHVDPEKVALTGHSMGGIGTWMIAYEYPYIFCRIAPLSGAVNRRIQRDPKPLSMPIWSFVGSDPSDENAYNSNTAFFPELQKWNPNAQLTILENAKHRDVAEVYLQFDIIGWLTEE